MMRARPRTRIPPLPQFVVLIDRDDETEWVLSYDIDAHDVVRISINDEGLVRPGLEEPRMDYVKLTYFDMGGGVRLFVRGGRLGYEMVEYEGTDAPIYARIGVRREIHQIVIPEGWEYPQALAFDEESGLD